MKDLSENIKPLLGLIIVIGVLLYFFLITWLFRNNPNVLSQVIIAMVGILGVVTGYYFGYSQGAAKKDDTIAALQPTQPNVGTANNVEIKN